MGKILIVITIILTLSGCNQLIENPTTENLSSNNNEESPSNSETNNPSTEKPNTYNNENYKISFQYPSNWQVQDSRVIQKWVDKKLVSVEESFEHSVVLITGDNQRIYFDYQSVNFDEYESRYKEPMEIGGLSIEETTMANYPAKQYIPYGLDASEIMYIINKNGRFVMFSVEQWLTKEQKIGLEVILNTFEF